MDSAMHRSGSEKQKADFTEEVLYEQAIDEDRQKTVVTATCSKPGAVQLLGA